LAPILNPVLVTYNLPHVGGVYFRELVVSFSDDPNQHFAISVQLYGLNLGFATLQSQIDCSEKLKDGIKF
jgi:hypothetical protein